jgi:hypothetical protein
MRNRVVGAIGVLWGGGILVSTFINGLPKGDSAYATGNYAGIIFGVAMFIAGAYYLLKGGAAKVT